MPRHAHHSKVNTTRINSAQMCVLSPATYRNREVLKTIDPMYDIMGREHRESLERRIGEILIHIQRTPAYGNFAIRVAEIQAKKRAGEDANVAIANLVDDVDEIVKKEESETGLDFWTRSAP